MSSLQAGGEHDNLSLNKTMSSYIVRCLIYRPGSPHVGQAPSLQTSAPGCVDMLPRRLERANDDLLHPNARQPEKLFSSPRTTQSAHTVTHAFSLHTTPHKQHSPQSAPTDTWHLSQHSSTAALLPLPVQPALIWRMAPPVQRCLAHEM